MLTSVKQTSFSFTAGKFTLRYLDDNYFLNLLAWSGRDNCVNMSPT